MIEVADLPRELETPRDPHGAQSFRDHPGSSTTFETEGGAPEYGVARFASLTLKYLTYPSSDQEAAR